MSESSELGPASTRAVRTWRVVLGLYAGAVGIGTHWPRLQLGDPEHPPDKLLHFVAFGGLAFFLWQARLVRSRWSLLALALAWTAVDEVTQGIPGLGRSISFEDVAAGWMGVVCTLLLLWATRPMRSPVAALRRRRFDGMIDLLLSRPVGWLGLVMSAAAGILLSLPTSVIVNGLGDDPTPFQAAVVGLLFGAGLGGAAYLIIAMRSLDESMMARRLCLGCGSAVEGTACSSCGRTPLIGQWLPMPGLSLGDLMRACLPPVAGAIGVILLTFILILFVAEEMSTNSAVLRLNTWWRGLAKGMDTDIHATYLCLILAVTVERCRTRLARRTESGHRVCLGCGHDLRSTPATGGTGRCGECGAGFVRVEMERAVESPA